MTKEILLQIEKLTGMVVGRNGKGGSGTCVRLEDGRVALLTAKHVVFDCIRHTGEVAIGVPSSGIDFHIPSEIRMDSSYQGDAAYLVSDQLTSLPAISFPHWTSNHPEIVLETQVYACGFPAVFKKVEGRKVHSMFAYLEDKILSVGDNSIICGINETFKNTPETLSGMSGGGLFSDTGEFLGIVVAERRRVNSFRGELDVLLPHAYQELYKPFSMPPEASKGGFLAEKIPLSLEMYDSSKKLIATVGVWAETFWSKTNPEHKYGRIGRLITLEIIIPGIDTHYPINIESLFSWTDDSDEGRRRAVQEEFKFLLLRMGWLLSGDEGSSQISLTVGPML